MTANKQHLKAEAADVFYHLLVLLEASGIELSQVMDELAHRMREGGLEEKASRKP
jgi:phosphoribosyl-ATP pyrophosphohydrolase